MISVPLTLLKTVCLPSSESSSLIYNPYSFEENREITESTIWNLYIISGEIIVRFGPGILLAILNFCIIWRFRKITKKRREILNLGGDFSKHECMLLRGERISKKIYKEEKRLVTLLMAIVLLFFITTTPVGFLAIFYSESYQRSLPFQIFRALANSLELCNFALNFYIYFLCSKEFRKKFLSFFTVLLPRKAKANFHTIALSEATQANNSINKVQTRVNNGNGVTDSNSHGVV